MGKNSTLSTSPDSWNNFTFIADSYCNDKKVETRIWAKDLPIAPLIYSLRKLGVQTSDSCAGHYNTMLIPNMDWVNVSYPWATYRIIRENPEHISSMNSIEAAFEEGGFPWNLRRMVHTTDREIMFPVLLKAFDTHQGMQERMKEEGFGSKEELVDKMIEEMAPKEPGRIVDTYLIECMPKGRPRMGNPNIDHNSLDIRRPRERVLAYQLESVNLARFLLEYFEMEDSGALSLMESFEHEMIDFYRKNNKLINEDYLWWDKKGRFKELGDGGVEIEEWN